ncbi:MAG: MFS transporter, partial [Actinomycetota bacterium]|nr:MFS transporter [Actinomycetota bacterium]
MLRRLVVDVTPLRELPVYRRWWLGSLLSGVGGQLTSFAVALQVFRATGSSTAVGLVALVVLVPTLVVGLAGGVVADSVDRRRLVLVTLAGQLVVSGALAAQASSGGNLPLVYVLVGVQAVLVALQSPAQRAMVPALLGVGRLPSGLALAQLSFQVSLVAGPALAGLLAAVGGVRLCYLLDAASFLVGLYAVARLPALRPVGATARRSPTALLEGLQFLRTRPAVAGALLSDLLATALAMPFALFPAVNALHFGGGATTLGLLGSAPAVGGVAAMALSGTVRHLARPGLGLLVTGAAWGLAVAGFGVTTMLWGALLCLGVAGAADTLSVVLRGAVVQLSSPDHLRGRMGSLEFVVGAGGPQLGNARA